MFKISQLCVSRALRQVSAGFGNQVHVGSEHRGVNMITWGVNRITLIAGALGKGGKGVINNK